MDSLCSHRRLPSALKMASNDRSGPSGFRSVVFSPKSPSFSTNLKYKIWKRKKNCFLFYFLVCSSTRGFDLGLGRLRGNRVRGLGVFWVSEFLFLVNKQGVFFVLSSV